MPGPAFQRKTTQMRRLQGTFCLLMGRIFPYLTDFCAATRRQASTPPKVSSPRRTRFWARTQRHALRLLTAALLGLTGANFVPAWLPPAEAQDSGVFRYRDRDGREVFTNLEGQASHGRALQVVDLPPLSSIDFGSQSPDDLRKLDARVHDSHSTLQAGEHCEAIRKSSRVPLRTRIWGDHGLKIYVSAALLAFSVLLGYLVSKRRLGSLFPVAPFLGFAFLVYATVRDTRATFQTLTAGLRACSEQLPDGDPASSEDVKTRLSKALDVRASVNAAYDRQADQIEAIMRER